VPDLVRVAQDQKRLVDPRWSAVVALGRLGPDGRAAVPAFVALLHDDPDADMREAAARSLGAVGAGEDSVAPLIAALGDPDQLVRESALEGLAALGPAAGEAAADVEALLDDAWPAVARAAGAALARIDPARPAASPRPHPPRDEVRDALGPLLAGLESDDERTRGISTFEIGKLGPEAAEGAPLLAELLSADGNLDVRWSAAWALGKMGAEAADSAPSLARALAVDPDPDVRGQAAWALGRIAASAEAWAAVALDVLERSLADPDSLVREETLGALASLGPRAAGVLPAVALRVGDARPLVRRRALDALVLIGERH
jgi:HEAT repeat protein